MEGSSPLEAIILLHPRSNVMNTSSFAPRSLGTEGGFNSEAYFIAKGRVQALSPVGLAEMSICAIFEDGDDFEIDSMLTDQIMRCTYRAISVTDLFWLELADFQELSDEYPACGENVRFHAMSHKKRMDVSLRSETKDLPSIGLCQSKVVYKSAAQPIEAVMSAFEEVESTDNNKIRTYRNIEVGPDGKRILHSDSSIMRSPSGLRDLVQPYSDDPEPEQSAYIGSLGSSAEVLYNPEEDKEEGDGGGGGGEIELTKVECGQEEEQEAGGKQEDANEAQVVSESGSPMSATPKRATVAIIRRKDSVKSQGSMMSLDTPMTLFKHSSFKRKKVIQVEVEETTADLAKRLIINPKEGKKIAWDLFVGLLILWSVIIVPFRLGFDQEPEDNSAMFYLDILVDVMFGIDIFLCFRVAYQDEQLVYVTEPRMIASNYFKGWFMVDFLSTFPIDRIIIAFQPPDSSQAIGVMNATIAQVGGDDGGNAARSLKMIKILRLIRLSKLARLFKLKNLVKGMDEILAISAVAMKALQLVTTMIFIGHLFGCFWNYTSSNLTDMVLGEEEAKERVWWKGPYVDDLSDERVGGLYIASLYWAFTTMTTVGYGDILPTNDVERVYSTLIMILGATIFGYIVGSVGALAINVNGAPARRHAKVSTAMNYMTEQNVAKSYKEVVKKQILYYLHCKSPFNEDGSMMLIFPREIKRELILQMHKDVVPLIPLFKRQSRDFVACVLTKMRPQKVSAGMEILNSNQGSDGIYFLLKGLAKMNVKNSSEHDKTLRKIFIEVGRFFGHEIYVDDELNSEPNLYRVYESVHDCELFVLLDIDVSHMLEVWPR